MYTTEIKKIEATIADYFSGIYFGDIERLETSLSDELVLYGDIKGEFYKKNVAEYIQGVAGRKSPKELGEIFAMKIVGIDVLGQIAMAKLHLPMLGMNYYDYVSLAKIEGNWKIVGRIFSHVA